MNRSRTFSPITDKERFNSALEYVTVQALALAQLVLHRQLNIDTLCLFAQSNAEYQFIQSAVRKHGPESRFSHGPTLYVDSNFMVVDQRIRILGVRQPDPSRPWVGYGDYPVDDYPKVVQQTAGSQFVREIVSGLGKPLLELKHPDLDVLGFIVGKEDHLS